MKLYLRKLALISLLLVVLLAVLAFASRAVVVRGCSWKLPERVHVLFLGASHVEYAVDDSMMTSAVNWARGSERYAYTYIKLSHLLEDNPRIDTVFLELAPTDLWADADDKYHKENEQSFYVANYWPFFSLAEWRIFAGEPLQAGRVVVANLLQADNVLRHDKWWKKMGGHEKTFEEMDAAAAKWEPAESLGHGNAVNYGYLRKIVRLCEKRGVKLYFLETPTSHIERIYDIAYFRDAYRKNFSDVEFVDYSDWPMADDERKDPHHLNHRGAVRFTREIMERFHIR